MPTQIPTGYGSAAFIFSGTFGTPAFVTTIGVALRQGGPTAIQAQANDMVNAFTFGLFTSMAASIRFEEVVITANYQGDVGGIHSTQTPFTGQRAGQVSPMSNSALVTKNTAVIGRRGRGRMFFPGLLIREDVDPGGFIVQARRDALETALDKFFTALVTGETNSTYPMDGPMVPVLLHSGGGTPSLISSLTLQPKIGTQRMRIR